ncbi:MAG: ribosome silencing factor [bacterium]|nr:ribosome silencing factor [bacterium]
MLARSCAEAALEKKALDVVVLDMRRLDAVTDFFVVCTADVDQHARAIVKNIEEHVHQATGDRVLHREGMEALNWVLLDYVDVVVHVFKPSFREFYKIEDLWGDAETLTIPNEMKATAPKPMRRKAEPAVRKAKAPAPRTRKTTATKKPAASPANGRRKSSSAIRKPTKT